MKVKIVVISVILIIISSNVLLGISLHKSNESFFSESFELIQPAGDPYFILLSDYTDGAGDDNLWAVQLRFDIELGIVESEFDNKTLPLITDVWVEIRIDIDLNNDWVKMYYNDDLLHQKEWSAGPENTGNGIVNLSAVNLFSDSSTPVYFDDFTIEEVGEGIIWSDDFDNYEEESPIHSQGGWKGWDNDPDNTAYVSNINNKSYPNSLKLSAGNDIVREYFGNYSGEFVYSAWIFFPENIAPYPPEIEGPSGGAIDRDIEFSFVASDPNLDDLRYFIDWGDGSFEEWIGPYSSGEVVTIDHSWSETGEFTVKAKAKDLKDYESPWSEPFNINISNPPDPPDIIGPHTIRAGRQYEFTFTATDPDGDDVKINISWGNGITDETSYIPSSSEALVSHSWEDTGKFTIEFYAEDIFNAKSDISSYEIDVPRFRGSSLLFNSYSEIIDLISNIVYQILFYV
jgi:hypothetical protein